MTLAVDCGKVITPSGATNQLAGGVIWSLTALLHGGVPIRRGHAVRSNFHENELLGMAECPAIDVHSCPAETRGRRASAKYRRRWAQAIVLAP